MRTARLGIGAVGVLLLLVGVLNLRDLDLDGLVSMLLWFAGGVIGHDALLAPLTILVVVVAARLVPRESRSVALVGFVVWGTVTLATANVLLPVGGVPSNESLLNRPYVASWLVLTALWWSGVAVLGWLAVRRSRARLRRTAGS